MIIENSHWSTWSRDCGTNQNRAFRIHQLMSSPREFRIASWSICMMEASNKKAAPVLSEADKKKSIASSKYQKRKVVLNTLDSPFDIRW
jgi:hypothetical protein